MSISSRREQGRVRRLRLHIGAGLFVHALCVERWGTSSIDTGDAGAAVSTSSATVDATAEEDAAAATAAAAVIIGATVGPAAGALCEQFDHLTAEVLPPLRMLGAYCTALLYYTGYTHCCAHCLY